MNTLNELKTRPAPAKRLQPIASFGGSLWVGSWENDTVYALDPETLAIKEQYPAPGKPYGIAPVGDDLTVVVAVGNEDDDRVMYRLRPGRGFDLDSKTDCPEFTGSYLTARDGALYLGQMTFRRIAVLKPDGTIDRTIELPTRCGGIGSGADGRFYMISGDDELEHLKFGTIDVSQDAPRFEEIASLPDEARSLAFDGTQWWTNLRDLDEIASFTA